MAKVDGIRELLDQFGESAVKLDGDLRRIGESRVSDRLVIIAGALQMAYLQGQVSGITGVDRGG